MLIKIDLWLSWSEKPGVVFPVWANNWALKEFGPSERNKFSSVKSVPKVELKVFANTTGILAPSPGT